MTAGKRQMLALLGIILGIGIALAEGISALGCVRLVSVLTVVAGSIGAGAALASSIYEARAARRSPPSP
jgi:hypothetical protein